MSVPYPVDDSQHLQIPDPDSVQFSSHSTNSTYSTNSNFSTHSTYSSTPFINPRQPLPYPPPQELPYPPQQSVPASQDGYGENFLESANNLQLNEGLQNLGKNLLKQGKFSQIFPGILFG